MRVTINISPLSEIIFNNSIMAKPVDSKMPTSSRKELGKTDDATQLPPGWEIKISKSRGGMMYYYNAVTRISTWTHPHSASGSDRQGKNTNEEKKSTLKDQKSADMKQSALSLISLHYTKEKDEPSSGFSQKRKAEKTVISGSSPAKNVKRKNTSTVHKSSIPEYVKHDKSTVQSEHTKTPTTIPPLIKKQNVKSPNSIDTKLQENRVIKKAKKRFWCPVEVSTVGESALKSFAEDDDEVSPPKKMATAKTPKNTLVNDGSQNVSRTSDSVNKTVVTRGGNALSDSKKNINDGGLISTTPVRFVVKSKKEEDGLNKKNIVNGAINSLHNETVHQSSSVCDAKTFKQNNKSEPSSYESLLNKSSRYENKTVNSQKSYSQGTSHLASNFNKNVTPQYSSDHVVEPHSLRHSDHYNKNRSPLLQDKSIVSQRSQAINTFAISNSPSRLSDPDKQHHSPLGNLFETSTTNSARDFLDSKVVYSSLTGQSSPSGADVEQDIEDMEVDEEALVILSNLQDVRTQTSSASDEPRGILTEIVTKAKPSSLSTNPQYDAYNGQVVLVVDTNVLIACLRFLQEVLTFNIPVYGQLILVMPWVVMQELDSLKSRKSSINNLSVSTSERASKAIKFIHAHLVDEDPQLIGQTPVEAREETEIEVQCNDDKILQCCLQFQRKWAGSQVVLLTRDVNLANKALIMGIKAASNETLWSHLKIPKPRYCTDQMNKEEINSTKGTPERIIPLESTKVNDTNSALLKLVMKCERLNSLQEVDAAKGLRDSSTTLRTSSPMTADCNLRNNQLLSENANSVITKVTAEHKRLPLTQEEKSVIINKFQAVWKLIYDMKLEIGTVVADGKSHANYNEAVQMLQGIIPLLSALRNDFDRCLSMSPIILWEHEAEFNSLCSHLNTFFMQAHTSYADPSQPLEVLQLIKYFGESGNRTTLFTGLEQLSVFVTEVEEIFKMCS